MHILAVDTSCDETSCAVLQDNKILSNVVSSQVELHKKWGGVVPDIARRAHRERIDAVISEALNRSRVELEKIDFFAATFGPGLAIALEVGLKKTQELAKESKKPFIPVNHMEGHLLSSFALNSKGNHRYGPPSEDKMNMPYLGLLVSGGHTEMVLMRALGEYEIIGETLDDAAGEAFDKVATMLELGYPGGPIISEFAKKGDPEKYDLPIPMEKSENLNFSYSGLKTACLYKIRDLKESRQLKGKQEVFDFCASFEEAVIRSVVMKLERAVEEYEETRIKGVLIGGGVMSNTHLRRRIRSAMRKRKVKVYQPYSDVLYTDNAGMIGVAAFYKARQDYGSGEVKLQDPNSDIDRNPVVRLGVED